MDDSLIGLGHPRARGEAMSDVTAFLESQKDWDLERDNGWTGIEVLFEFAVPKHTRSSNVSWLFDEGRVVLDLDNDPVKDYKDIPLTLSSEVEGALMEAISRLDDNIKIYDFWARLSVHLFRATKQLLTSDRPKYCKSGGILTPGALSRRMGRFRLENAVTAQDTRKGSKALREFLWNRMSLAARDANSTRELKKLSKEEQAQAKEPNAGKHAANAGGWAKGENQAEEKVSAQTSAEGEGATIPAVRESRKNNRPQRTPKTNTNRNEERQSSFSAPEESRQLRSNKRRKVREPTPSATHTLQNPYPEVMYEDTMLDAFSYSQVAFHGHGWPLSTFTDPYSILPTEVAAGASSDYPQFHPVPNNWNPAAGFDSARQSMGALASSWNNSQHMLPAAQGQITHPPLGVECALDNTDDLFSPGHIDQRALLTVQHQNTHRSVDVEGPLDNPSGPIYPHDRSFEDHVEAYFFGTSLRNLEHQTHPMENQSSGEIDYRTIRPQGEEDRFEIQRALVLTKCNYWLRTGNDCPPTETYQSYSYQVKQVLDSLAMWWAIMVGPSSPTPDLVKCHAPWRNGFADWDIPTGGDRQLVDEGFHGWREAHGELV